MDTFASEQGAHEHWFAGSSNATGLPAWSLGVDRCSKEVQPIDAEYTERLAGAALLHSL